MSDRVHVSSVGTYHGVEDDGATWTIHDTRGYMDTGPSCDNCGACECEDHDALNFDEGDECIGLSFAFVCLDGGESLCEDCAAKAGIEIVECDCE